MIIIVILLVIGLIISIRCNIVLLKKVEHFEDYVDDMETHISQFHQATENVLQQIKSIDLRGSFEADDEVGIIYKGISGVVKSLEQYINKGG